MRCVVLLCLCCVISFPLHASESAVRDAYAQCLAQLPGPARLAFEDRSRAQRYRVPRRLRAQWQACRARERDVADGDAIQRLSHDLVQMAGQEVARDEARQIAQQLVKTTRRFDKKYQMVGSPLLNNLLVHVGAKQMGFCYHWTANLAQAVQDLPWKYFSRVWGVANLRRVTENNALIIVARDAPLAHGLVYDAWRGAGSPFWRRVTDDHYAWQTRFTETNLERGVGFELAADESHRQR
jgi:hypothetical protein